MKTLKANQTLMTEEQIKEIMSASGKTTVSALCEYMAKKYYGQFNLKLCRSCAIEIVREIK